MSPGVGRLITTVAGYFMTTTGPGCRAAGFTATVVGGGPLSWRSVSHSETTSAGIHLGTTIAIRIRVDIVTMIAVPVTVVAVMAGVMVVAAVAEEEEDGRTCRVATTTISRGVVSRECRVEILARRMAAAVRLRMNELHVA